MSTRPARTTSRLMSLVASSMSCSRSVSSPVAPGCWRSCWSRNWESEIATLGMARCGPLVGEPRNVLVLPVAVRHRVGERERSRYEGHQLADHGLRAADRELGEQEGELLLERAGDRVADLGGEAPQLALEHAERLLAGLVEKLLVGVAALPLVGGRGAQLL